MLSAVQTMYPRKRQKQRAHAVSPLPLHPSNFILVHPSKRIHSSPQQLRPLHRRALLVPTAPRPRLILNLRITLISETPDATGSLATTHTITSSHVDLLVRLAENGVVSAFAPSHAIAGGGVDLLVGLAEDGVVGALAATHAVAGGVVDLAWLDGGGGFELAEHGVALGTGVFFGWLAGWLRVFVLLESR
jgi:hypothetical protein